MLTAHRSGAGSGQFSLLILYWWGLGARAHTAAQRRAVPGRRSYFWNFVISLHMRTCALRMLHRVHVKTNCPKRSYHNWLKLATSSYYCRVLTPSACLPALLLRPPFRKPASHRPEAASPSLPATVARMQRRGAGRSRARPGTASARRAIWRLRGRSAQTSAAAAAAAAGALRGRLCARAACA